MPKNQLLGVRGAPGNTVNHPTSYWVPKHSPRVFVEKVDMVSGVGTDKDGGPFHEIRYVISDLGVMDLRGPGGTMRLVSVHPGVTVDEVQAQTGFSLHVEDVVESRLPTDEELRLIREVLDPRTLRDKEVPPV